MKPTNRWTLATVAVIAGTAAAHAWFIAHDGRLPRDMGLYYTTIRGWYAGWGGAELPTDDLLHRGGWYNALLAGALRLLGRSREVFRSFDVLWVSCILGSVALLSRRLASPRAGFFSAAVVATVPGVVVYGRWGWIHVPEAALALAALVVWTADRRLARARTVALLGVLGGLVIALRPSGLVLIGLLAPALFLRGEDGVRPVRRALAVCLLWGAASLVPLGGLDLYLSNKLAARPGYQARLGPLGWEIFWTFGLWPSVLVLIGLSLGGRRGGGVIALLWVWVGSAFFLFALFRAGIDNFTYLWPCLAVLAGLGVARLPRVLPALAAAWWVLWTVPQFDRGLALAAVGQVPTLLHFRRPACLLNYYRPYRTYGEREIDALLAASCQPSERCRVFTLQGVPVPFSEEPGNLEVFLAGWEDVRVVNLLSQDLRGQLPDAFVDWNCPSQLPADRRDRLAYEARVKDYWMRNMQLVPIWSATVDPACTVTWYTPNGRRRDLGTRAPAPAR